MISGIKFDKELLLFATAADDEEGLEFDVAAFAGEFDACPDEEGIASFEAFIDDGDADDAIEFCEEGELEGVL